MSKNEYTLQYQETIIEIYMFVIVNIKEWMYTALLRNNYGNVHVWKYQKRTFGNVCLEISKNGITL